MKKIKLLLIICLGILFLGCGDSNDFKNLEKKAKQGDLVAQYNLGNSYIPNSKRGNIDYKKAFYWFEKSAEQGLPPAQYELAVMYSSGEYIKQDYEKAFELYEKSAIQGYAPAQYNLSFMYAMGQSVEKNNQKAVEWLKKSANNGFPPAIKELENSGLKHK